MKHVSKYQDLPRGDSFCAIKNTTTYTPGDERSRTHPGHGYPESWDPTIEMISFGSSDDLSTWASKNLGDLSKYRFFKMVPMRVEPTFTIGVTPGSDTMGYSR